jgi:GTP cyclohydrolase IA
MDTAKIAQHWEQLLTLIGDDPKRPGLKDTPARVAKAYAELFSGYDMSKKPRITTFPNGTDGLTYDQMIIDEGTFTSFCEHHCLPFTGSYWFSYIPAPKGRILGLSKVARVINFHAARLQIQERLVKDVTDDLWAALAHDGAPKGMALVIKARHLCKCMRGVRQGGEMTTIELRGLFKEDAKTRLEFFTFVRSHG